jgi:hypothetical protein
MYPAPDNVASHRFARLAPKLADKAYRDGYVSTQLRIWLADQVRALRGDMTQAEFGKLIGKPQAVVSRLEDPDYGRLTIETLLEVASKLDIALLVRFVDHATFLIATNDFSDSALRPAPYNQTTINALAAQSAEVFQLGQSTTAFTGVLQSGAITVSTGNTIHANFPVVEGTGVNMGGAYSSGAAASHTFIQSASGTAFPSWSWTTAPAPIAITDKREFSHG